MTSLYDAKRQKPDQGKIYRWVRGPKAWYDIKSLDWIRQNSRRDMFLFVSEVYHWACGPVAELFDLKRKVIVQLYPKDFQKMVEYEPDDKQKSDVAGTNPQG